MSPDDFAGRAQVYCQETGGSVTSWGRTPAHNAKVGGVPTSYHVRWLAVDVVYDTPLDDPTEMARRQRTASDLGLTLIHEPNAPGGPHDHLQGG